MKTGLLAFLFALLTATVAQAQSCGTISTCPAASTPLSGSEVVLGVQNSATVKIPTSSIAALVPTPTPVGFPRASISTTTIGANKTISVSGYRTSGDLGAGAVYTSTNCMSGGLLAIQDLGGNWFCLVVTNGQVQTGWFGTYADYTWAGFSGSIAGTTLTITGGQFTVSGFVAIGQCLTGAGIAANTCISGGSGSTWTVTQSQTVASERMAATSGHDDSAAIQAALNTGQDVNINGLQPALTDQFVNTSWSGVSTPIVMPAVTGQKLAFHSTGLIATPTFSGGNGYVLASGSAYQTIQDPLVDAGQSIGVTAGAIYMGGSSGSRVINPKVQHYATTGICMCGVSGDQWANNVDATEWKNNEGLNQVGGVSTMYFDPTAYTGTAMEFSRADDKVLGAILRWSGTGVNFDCASNGQPGAQTNWLDDIHIYGGVFVSSGPAPVPFPKAVAIHSCGQTPGTAFGAVPGNNFIDNLYLDESSIEVFNPDLSIRNIWTLADPAASVLNNASFVNVYAWSMGAPYPLDYRFMQNTTNPGCNLTGSVSGTTLTVTAIGTCGSGASVTAGYLIAGDGVIGASIPAETYVTGPISPWNGSAGTYALNNSFSAVSESINIGRLFAIKYLDNPNKVTITGASGDGVHATLTVAAWLNDFPQPQPFSAITVTGNGGYNCARCTVTASTTTSVSYASAATSATSGGSIQLVWPTAWSGVNDNYSSVGFQGIESGNRLITKNDTNSLLPMLGFYQAGSDGAPCVKFTYELGASGAQSFQCFSNKNAVTVSGAGSGPPTVLANGTGVMTLTAGTAPGATWTFTFPATPGSGYGCMAKDLTTPADIGTQTPASLASTTTPVIGWSPTPTAGDVVQMQCGQLP